MNCFSMRLIIKTMQQAYQFRYPYMKTELLSSIWAHGQNVYLLMIGYMINMNPCQIILKLQMCLFVQEMWRHGVEAF
mgnify:CR=1 FL=1